jgi:hypothetical protein
MHTLSLKNLEAVGLCISSDNYIGIYKEVVRENEFMIGKWYRHYKGDYYKVIGFSLCSEGRGALVKYTDEDDTLEWSRPFSMWNEAVGDVPRYDLAVQ